MQDSEKLISLDGQFMELSQRIMSGVALIKQAQAVRDVAKRDQLLNHLAVLEERAEVIWQQIQAIDPGHIFQSQSVIGHQHIEKTAES